MHYETPVKEKYLIIRNGDIGMSHSVNMAFSPDITLVKPITISNIESRVATN